MNELVTKEPENVPVVLVNNVLEAIMQCATNPAVDINKLERLMVLQDGILKNERLQAYNKAMQLTQSDLQIIKKEGWNPQFESKYVTLEAIVRVITEHHTKHGLSVSFRTEKSDLDKHLRLHCKIAHIQGHVEEQYFDLPFDISGSKNAIQARGSTITYGRRFMLEMIFNLASTNDDDGETSGEVKVITKEDREKEERLAAVQDRQKK